MILKEQKIFFLHIPKTAGMAISKELLPGIKPNETNYDHLVGWCPKRRIWMQHATIQQLIEFELVTEDELADYYIFTITRNPFDRAVSDYFFQSSKVPYMGSFESFINQTGIWTRLLDSSKPSLYRADHWTAQADYITLPDREVDLIGRFENLGNAVSELNKVLTDRLGRPIALQSINRSKRPREHYSLFYSDTEIELISKKYHGDLQLFDYSFEDKRHERSMIARKSKRLYMISKQTITRNTTLRIKQNARRILGPSET